AISDSLGQWLSAIPDWLSFLRWLIWPVVALTLAIITGYLFTVVAILIASPFNALLAEKAEELIRGKPVAGLEGFAQAIAGFPRAMGRELVKFAYYLPLVLVVFVLSLIPPVTAVAPVLWFLLGAWMMAVQYVDYPMDNHLLSFAEVKQVLRQRRLSSLGFGGLVALVSAIPILNFFVVPAAVCGATLFWCEELSLSD
ncbi:MAG: sulfate transporter CysZ, partial [Lysobacterales bacterium]